MNTAEAVEALFALEPNLVRYLKKRISDAQVGRWLDEQDILTSMMKSICRRDELRIFAFRGWVFEMARHKVAKAVQRHRREQHDAPGTPELNVADSTPGPEVEMELLELKAKWWATLEPYEQDVVAMKEKGMGAEEIAEAIDRVPRTVRRILAAAQKKLRDILSMSDSKDGENEHA